MSKSAHEVQNWLINYVAEQMGMPADQVDPDEELVNLGLSSRQAIVLTAKLEAWIDRPTDPALIWEYPTIRLLAQHLGQPS